MTATVVDAGEARAATGPDAVGGAALTPQSLIRLDYFPPDPDLAPYITTFYLFRCDEAVIRDIQPASPGHLHVYLAGEGTLHFPGGRDERAHPVSLMGPMTAAAPFTVTGTFHTVGAVLAPLGWAALTGLHASENADRLLDAVTIFGPEAAAMGERVRALYAADPDGSGAAMAAEIAAFIRARLGPLPDKHVALVRATVDWMGTSLDPKVEDLYARLDYSPRQVQRLVACYFGSNPTHLARKYRATRVAALLAQPGIDDHAVAALTDHFYDQPHMIREIREFIGRTPARLGKGDAPILEAVVNVRNFVQIKPHIAPLPEDLAPVEKDADDA
ncbi:helix-turn-helix domain-containing protein [Tsuneonella amylolytica]|uniref:helix-turn-helix domain-containing protein n=1 Tax=Tsuneonella amylolytica TaxID=2338327 RepID=UPI000EA9D638|nr:helix-turn-helix domain-containing protein [Tsuneonella amylolytica]